MFIIGNKLKRRVGNLNYTTINQILLSRYLNKIERRLNYLAETFAFADLFLFDCINLIKGKLNKYA
jgi:hypothetical protein